MLWKFSLNCIGKLCHNFTLAIKISQFPPLGIMLYKSLFSLAGLKQNLEKIKKERDKLLRERKKLKIELKGLDVVSMLWTMDDK